VFLMNHDLPNLMYHEFTRDFIIVVDCNFILLVDFDFINILTIIYIVTMIYCKLHLVTEIYTC
jgi:hypothetical protein